MKRQVDGLVREYLERISGRLLEGHYTIVASSRANVLTLL